MLESRESERVFDGVLKKGPSTAPGATRKLNTALNRFRGVGSIMARSSKDPSRISSLAQVPEMAFFQAAGGEAGIFRALIITFSPVGVRRRRGRL
jgi:hypothetical protein